MMNLHSPSVNSGFVVDETRFPPARLQRQCLIHERSSCQIPVCSKSFTAVDVWPFSAQPGASSTTILSIEVDSWDSTSGREVEEHAVFTHHWTLF